MRETARIVFEEDGYPRELVDLADMKRAVERDQLRQDMTVIVYRPGAAPSSQVASDVDELRPLFGLPVQDAAEVAAPVNQSVPEEGLAPVQELDLSGAELPSIPSATSVTRVSKPHEPARARKRNSLWSDPLGKPRLEEPVRPPPAVSNSALPENEGVPFNNHFTSHYGVLNGRETRAQYFSFAFVALVITLVAMGISSTLGWLVVLGLFFPGWGAAARRLHDAGLSGWVLLVGLIPYIGALILLILLLLPSSADEKYGPVITVR